LVETGEDTGEIKLLREWSGCRSRTLAALGAALVVLLAAVLALTYGNYLGDTAAPHG
jgi:L-rhamnose-H+ transport protein